MNKLYLIMRGEYSDTECLGYCTTRKKAKEYCAVKNMPRADVWWKKECYVAEVNCLDGNIEGDVEVGKIHTVAVRLDEKHGGWEFRLWDLSYYCQRMDPVVQTVDKGRFYKVRVWQPRGRTNRDLIKKIAQDTFYQRLSEQVIYGPDPEPEEEQDYMSRVERYLTT